MLGVIQEMRDAGLSTTQIVGEFVGAVCLFALPIMLMFMSVLFE
jgi:ABC-type maltose transport system permease subunit